MNQNNQIASLGNVLDLLVKSLGIEKQVEQYKVFEAWNSIVGEQISKVAQPERLQNSILIVSVNNAPWRAELTYRKRDILEKIHLTLKTNSITDIRFR